MANAYQLISISQVDGLAAALELAMNQTPQGILDALLTVDGPGSGLNADLFDGYTSTDFVLTSAYTAADVLAKLLTVDGSGSGIDADLLDGQHGSYYAPIASPTFTGLVTTPDIKVTGGTIRGIGTTALLQLDDNFGASMVYGLGRLTVGGPMIFYYNSSEILRVNPTSVVFSPTAITAGGNSMWHAGNDGAGSTLDADLLDGQHGSYYQNAGNLNAGTILAARMPALTGDITTAAGAVATTLAAVNGNVGSFGSATAAPIFTVNAKGLITAASSATITPAWSVITSKPTTISGYGITDLLTSILAIDGAGSGIDADLLDGLNSSAFALLSGAAFTGQVNVSVADSTYAAALNSTTGNLRLFGYNSTYTASVLVAYNAGYAGYGPIALNGSSVKLFTGDTQRLTIDSSGNVGIAVTGPTQKLHVVGTFGATGGASMTEQLFGVDVDGQVTLPHAFSSGYAYIKAPTGRGFRFRSGTTTLLDFPASTSGTLALPYANIRVGDSSAGGYSVYVSSIGVSDLNLRGGDGDVSRTADVIISVKNNVEVARFADTGTVSFAYSTVTAAGNAVWHAGNDGAGSTLDADLLDGQQGAWYAPIASPTFTGTVTMPAFSVTSDQRLKTMIEPIKGYGEFLDATKIYSFVKDNKHQFGVLAHEAQEVRPELVGSVEHEEFGEILTVNPMDYLFALVAEVKELRKRIAALESK